MVKPRRGVNKHLLFGQPDQIGWPLTLREDPEGAFLETFTFETFDQSDEEAWPDQQKDNDKGKDNDNDKDIDKYI